MRGSWGLEAHSMGSQRTRLAAWILVLSIALLCLWPHAAHAQEEGALVDEASGLAAVVAVGEGEPTDLVTEPPADGDEQASIQESEPQEKDEPVAEAADGAEAPEAPMADAQPLGEGIAKGQPIAPRDDTPAPPEGAVEVEEGTYVLQSEVAPDRVLDASGKDPVAGASVATWSYNGGGNQAWDVERDEDSGWYRLYVNHAAGNKRLALGLRPGTCDACLVDTDGATSLKELLWAFVTAGESYHLVNAAHPTKSLDVYGNSPDLAAHFVLWDTKHDASKNQCFQLVERHPQVAESDVELEGTYNLVLSDADRMVDVDNAGMDNGANVLLWSGNGGRNQRVCLESDGEGYHIAWVLSSGKVLDVAGGSILHGTNVLQWEYKGTDNQKWALREADDGSFTLVNKGTGLVLGAHTSALAANVCGVGASDASARTSFTLKRANLVDEGICVIRSNVNRRLVFDVDHASTGTASLLLWHDTGALNQRFELVRADADGTWRLRTASSGGWVTLVNGCVRQEGKGATPASAANSWKAIWHKGSIQLVSLASELAADPFYGAAQAGTFLGNAPVGAELAQGLVIEPASLLSAGLYFFGNDYGKYLEVAGLSIDEGTNVQVGERAGSFNQLFRIEPNGRTCRIINALSGKALQTDGAASARNVTQRTVGNSTLQQWVMRIADGGHVCFESAANRSIALDAWGGGATAGTNVGTYENNSSKAQAWRAVPYVEAGMSGWQARAVQAAKTTPSTAGGLCALWVSNVFRNAGIGSWDGDARDLYSWYCHSNDLTALRPGMIVAVSSHGHTWAGSIWGHVSIYIGGGQIMDSVGRVRTMSLAEWAAWYGNRVTVRWGWIGGRVL